MSRQSVGGAVPSTRRGAPGPRRFGRALLAALGALSLLAARRADAQPEGVEVLVLEDPATDWGRRVRGQLSDLPASAQIRALPTLGGRSAATDAAALAPSNALTAWITTAAEGEPSGRGGTYIAIWLAGARAPNTRRIADAWGTLSAGDRSAALELAALSVRSAVRSLLLDRAQPNPANRSQRSTDTTAGATSAEPALESTSLEPMALESRSLASTTIESTASESTGIESTASEPTERESTASEPPGLEPTASEPPFPLRFGLELGMAWQFYGRTAPGDPGLRGGISLLGEGWSVALLGHYGWPMSARLGAATFDLQRHALLAELGVVVYELEAWRFSPLVRAGLTWLGRDDTRAGGAGAALDASQAAAYRSPFFGLGAIVERRLSEALSLSARGVLNVETAIPTFTLVDASGERVSSASPWNVQPSIELGARWHF